jgi:hypothetical protein
VKKLGTERCGEYVGGQVRSLLALINYFAKGENRERYLGVKIPATNLKLDYREQARAFAGRAGGSPHRRSAERVIVLRHGREVSNRRWRAAAADDRRTAERRTPSHLTRSSVCSNITRSPQTNYRPETSTSR